ncbi:hypothetical protein J4476_02615 [Candidatus Woesearchaeota archaeon]|nr:MAG: hypothetical protein QT09_C0008G0030 [archaeon GW2011_AR18]MBS3161562.1 hypothetical protein [Candidatus Woesearchaeota archaeon]HIH25657.1 hypothetical protein [Nanoarchaeota archaeon]
MEKGEFVVLGVILVGLFLFMFSSSDISNFSGNSVAPNNRPYCKSACGGDMIFRQPATLTKESFTIEKSDYFVVDTSEDTVIFKFNGVQRDLNSDYIILEKMFSYNKINYVKNAMTCVSYDYENVPFDFGVFDSKIPIGHNKDGNSYDLMIPVHDSMVRARLLYYVINGKENFKLHVDLDNDGYVGGEVNVEKFRHFKVCDNINPY